MSFPNLLQNSFPNPCLVLWTPPLVPPRHHRTFRRADENFALRSTLALIFHIFYDFFASLNFIKNRMPQKATQNHKKSAKARISSILGSILVPKSRILGSFFDRILDTIFQWFWEGFGGHFRVFLDAKASSKQKSRKYEKPMFDFR